MHDAALLSLIQLERLKALWVEQRAPIVEHLRPGLGDADIDSQLGPLGLQLPAEAALWWKWHDGVSIADPGVMGGWDFRFLALDDAVRQYQQSRGIAEYAASEEGEADRLWHPSWFPITVSGSGGVVSCDCSVPEGASTPIRMVHWGHKEDSDVPVAASFGQMVAWWIDAIERGAWRYDTNLGRWEIDHQKLADPRRELTRLV